MKPTSSLNQMSVEDSPPGAQHQRQQNGGKRGGKAASGSGASGGSGNGGGGSVSLNTSLTHQQYLGKSFLS